MTMDEYLSDMRNWAACEGVELTPRQFGAIVAYVVRGAQPQYADWCDEEILRGIGVHVERGDTEAVSNLTLEIVSAIKHDDQ